MSTDVLLKAFREYIDGNQRITPETQEELREVGYNPSVIREMFSSGESPTTIKWMEGK